MTGEMSMPPRSGIRLRIGRRFRDWVKEVADHGVDLIEGIHHVESDQPGQDCGRDQQPDVDVESEIDDQKQRAHGRDPEMNDAHM